MSFFHMSYSYQGHPCKNADDYARRAGGNVATIERTLHLQRPQFPEDNQYLEWEDAECCCCGKCGHYRYVGPMERYTQVDTYEMPEMIFHTRRIMVNEGRMTERIISTRLPNGE